MQLQRGTRAFNELCVAVFAAGFTIFSLLYSAQALLPALAEHFQLTPAASSLAVSAATAAVSVSIVLSGFVAESLDRRALILVSMLVSSLLTLLAAVTQSWHLLLLGRAALGLALGLMPPVLIAYLSEEVETTSLGFATGLYISGSVFGGMAGRLVAGLITDAYNWRIAFAVLGAASLAGTVYSWHALPASRHFVRRAAAVGAGLQRYLLPLRDAGLPWIFLAGSLLMGGFITIYNYVAFRLIQAPYGLSQGRVALIFTLYLLGMVSSAWAGALTGRYGRRHLYWPAVALMLTGVVCTLGTPLWLIACGVGLMTFGFFGAHSLASSWVGVRGGHARAQAAALYLFGFYFGSSVAGWAGGLAWSRFGWNGVAGMVITMVALALAIAVRLARLPPLPRTPAVVEPLRAAN
jgi:YNFM family putative membrane transporter